MKFASLFSGGGGVDIGAIMAGVTPVWGVEINPKIAAIYRQNIGDVLVSDITMVNPSEMLPVDILHASPVCKSFSIMNPNKGEIERDLASATVVAKFIRELQPQTFTLENVIGYSKSESWKIILGALKDYFWDAKVLDASNFGVPQSRKRLFLVANRSRFPRWPCQTHRVGWHSAISDLLPSCQPAKMSPYYQKKFLNVDVRPLLVEHSGARGNFLITRKPWEPVWTLLCSNHRILVLDQPETVALSLRCLARLQGFPDSYQLDCPKNLAAEIIGNSVPPPLYAQILKVNL